MSKLEYIEKSIESDFTQSGIIDRMTDDDKDLIANFLDYYSQTRSETESLSDKDILKLPFLDNSHREYNIWKKRARHYQLAMGLIRDLESSKESIVIDVGAGNCWFSRRLIENGFRVYSVDPLDDSRIGLKRGDIFEKELGIRLRRYKAMMNQLPFDELSVNGVVFCGSLHYAQNLTDAMKEAFRVLKPNGWIVIFDSPVFGNNNDGQKMVERSKLIYDKMNSLGNLEYQPIWYIDSSLLLQQARSLGLDIEVIKTRQSYKKFADYILNTIKGTHRWPDFPIILLRKKGNLYSKRNVYADLRKYYYRIIFEHKYKHGEIHDIDGIKIELNENAFNPIPFVSSKFLLKVLSNLADNLSGRTVLDMGTGSGLIAIRMAQFGACTHAADINPYTLESARMNFKHNSVENKINIMCSDLFSELQNQRYDIITFNPPFYDSNEYQLNSSAWVDQNHRTTVAFIKELRNHLTIKGFAIIVLSDRMNLDKLRISATQSGLNICEIAKKRHWDETFFVWKLTLNDN